VSHQRHDRTRDQRQLRTFPWRLAWRLRHTRDYEAREVHP
jgi:hypothetical protein